MADYKNEVLGAIASHVEASGDSDYHSLRNTFDSALLELAEQGVVRLQNDHLLGGKELEIRSLKLFQGLGLNAEWGRPLKEDILIDAPNFADYPVQFVLEVKGRKNSTPEMSDLRQLDDWIFDLSGESGFRQAGMEKPQRNALALWKGAVQPRARHPSPVKGVMIYNGEKGTAFDQRSPFDLPDNQLEFVRKRHICVISFASLVAWETACLKSEMTVEEFWQKMKDCRGILVQPG